MPDQKQKELLTKYIGDMHALEAHILQALDKQASGLADHPTTKAKVATYRRALAAHLPALEARLQALGGSATHPVKEGVASALGVAAGVIDKMRGSEAAKDLRDDYTAINHAVISYIMLYTTASAAGDQETAELSRRHLTDNARFVMEITHLMPDIVVSELRQDGMSADETAIERTKQVLTAVWQQPAGA